MLELKRILMEASKNLLVVAPVGTRDTAACSLTGIKDDCARV